MKRLLALILLLSLMVSVFAGCEQLPEEVVNVIETVKDKVGLGEETQPEVHEHEFTLVREREANCMFEGMRFYECACGEKKQEPGDPVTEHDYKLTFTIAAKCYANGSETYKCSICGLSKTEVIPATGEHIFDESTEASRILRCSNHPCVATKDREYENIYEDVLKVTFTEADKDRFYELHAELDAIIKAADAYDPDLHAYAEGSDLEAAYLAMEAKYEELYDVLEFITGQYQLAQIEYHMDMTNEEKKNNYDYIVETRTQLVADFYIFSKPIYDSMYREYYYYGMTEQEIQEFLYDSDAVGNQEYQDAVNRNKEIELEFDELENPDTDVEVLALYEEFVANNNKIAALMDYENYLEYAYEAAYDRDYSYLDVQLVREYVKEYIVPIYIATYDRWNYLRSNGGFSQGDVDSYYYQVGDSFFEVYESNRILNDYIDLLAFTSNPDKQITFSDEFNKLMSDGNLFRGEYKGAYVTNIYGLDIPIAFFGPGYDNPFTVVHEFGHYMNEVYGGGEYSQSYDLLEMHSQGNEVLYLAYLNGKMTKMGYELCKTYNLLVMLDTAITALIVDTFEQAVYTNFYDGENVGTIMDDGKITANEYDLLFNSIIADFGTEDYTYSTYWRHVTIHAPCYYVSYSISALSVLQLYPLAEEDFDAAVESYLKLFTHIDTYTDEDDYMTVEEVLDYAGLYSYTDEELYKKIYECLYVG